MSYSKIRDSSEFEAVLSALELAKSVLLYSEDSPIEHLLEAAISLCLVLAKALEEGRDPIARKNNPDLIFLDNEVMGPLGNSLSVRKSVPRKIKKYNDPWLDPNAADFLRNNLSLFFANLHHRLPFPTAIMALEVKDNVLNRMMSQILDLRQEVKEKTSNEEKRNKEILFLSNKLNTMVQSILNIKDDFIKWPRHISELLEKWKDSKEKNLQPKKPLFIV